MFTYAEIPYRCEYDIPYMAVGYGKIYHINKDNVPYMEIETDSSQWNPFNTACFFRDYFCIGNGAAVYFVNLYTLEIKKITLDMYFGYFYYNSRYFFVTSSSQLLCFNDRCELCWQADDLAVDGVVIDEFQGDFIYISCELDPPGGWVRRKIRMDNGKEELILLKGK